MTGLLVAIAYGLAVAIPTVYASVRISGLNGYQIEHGLGRSFKQHCERALLIAASLVSAVCGGYIVYVTFPNCGYESLFGGLLVSVVSGAVTLIFGCILVPDTELNQSAWLESARAKHDVIRKYGWGGAARRMQYGGK